MINGLKLENGILKEVGSNESDVCLLIYHLIIYDTYMTKNPTENNWRGHRNKVL